MNIFWGSRTQSFPTPPCLCELVDIELVPQLATMVLSSTSLWNSSVTLWIHLYAMASIYPRSSLSNTISFLNDGLDTALNTAPLISFRMPHSSRSNCLAYLVHSCRWIGNSLIYADLVSIYLAEINFIIFLLFYYFINEWQDPEALSPFINP